jgi:phosphohistidine phosphatase
MDLILWRHAEAFDAEDLGDDLDRVLTPRGAKQAKRAGQWLSKNCPGSARIFASPAKRCQQTAQALERTFQTAKALAPEASAAHILEFVHWPVKESGAVLIVGHQPALGECIASILELESQTISIPKGAFWWLSTRDQGDGARLVVRAVLTPQLL